MNTTHSIIVYRNPAEAALWESGMVFPLGASLGAGFFLFLALMWVAGKFSTWRGPGNLVVGAAGIASLAAAVLVFNWLAI